MRLGSRDVTRIEQARAQKAERAADKRRMSSIVQPRFDKEEVGTVVARRSSSPASCALDAADAGSAPLEATPSVMATPTVMTSSAAGCDVVRGDSLYVPRGWGGGGGGGAMDEAGSGGLAGGGGGKGGKPSRRWLLAHALSGGGRHRDGGGGLRTPPPHSRTRLHVQKDTALFVRTPSLRSAPSRLGGGTLAGFGASDQLASPPSHRSGSGTAPRHAASRQSPPPPATHWQGESDGSAGFPFETDFIDDLGSSPSTPMYRRLARTQHWRRCRRCAGAIETPTADGSAQCKHCGERERWAYAQPLVPPSSLRQLRQEFRWQREEQEALGPVSPPDAAVLRLWGESVPACTAGARVQLAQP